MVVLPALFNPTMTILSHTHPTWFTRGDNLKKLMSAYSCKRHSHMAGCKTHHPKIGLQGWLCTSDISVQNFLIPKLNLAQRGHTSYTRAAPDIETGIWQSQWVRRNLNKIRHRKKKQRCFNRQRYDTIRFTAYTLSCCMFGLLVASHSIDHSQRFRQPTAKPWPML